MEHRVLIRQFILTGSINEILGRPSGSYYIGPAVSGMPYAGHIWYAQTVSSGAPVGEGLSSVWILIISNTNGHIFSRLCQNDVWANWVRLPEINPHIKLNLPLSAAFSPVGEAVYFKDPFSMVNVKGAVLRDSALSTANTIGHLPVGYWPSIATEKAVHVSSPMTAGILNISTAGAMVLSGSFGGQTTVYLDFSFLTA